MSVETTGRQAAGQGLPQPRAVTIPPVGLEGLQAGGFATLLFDLPTEAEGTDRANVFDIALPGERLAMAIAWQGDVEAVRGQPVGPFGASTGAAAALVAAARADTSVGAVVSRGGRPDLAGSALQDVAAPTLFLVGGNDTAVLDLNRLALAAMSGPHDLRVIPGASHLFKEPGTLDAVITGARTWFAEKLTGK